ncbi:MAG TPA: 4-hydroxyphenylacetate 3-hydroxylase N-terminal domain-containing protein [Syntrophorhabdales bacterium]|nr:4-hydroxyphenylacetate 3-hydroxylase N-terminal domain-containing protein [Syntrophorhabdales bacterium]
MALRTVQQYRDSLKDQREVYCLGEKVEDVTTHPYLKICTDWCASYYVLTHDPRFRDLFIARADDGEEVSFNFMPIRKKEDLLRRREIVRAIARMCFGKPSGAQFTGVDGLNAVTVVSQRVDKALGTSYSGRVAAFRKYMQKNDLTLALAMTDVKGDRSLRPSQQQPHQDYYVRVVEERPDGIIVRGAKAHISHAPCNNEILVVPCRAMKEDDKAYALSFAVPSNTKGVRMICAEPEIKDVGNFFDYPISASIYLADSLLIFDDAFIPKERVFLNGEYKFAGDIAYMFGNFHRLSAETYKAVELEYLTGAAALMAEYNGIEKASHVVEKLTNLVMVTEAVDFLSRAACEHAVSEPDIDLIYPNPMCANIAKYYFAENFHGVTRILQDIGGGIVGTIPSVKDLQNPKTKADIEKYLGGKAGVPTEHRMRLIRLIRDLTSAYEDVITIHAEGSMAAQRLSIVQLADFDRYKAAAKRAAGIRDGKSHPVYSELPEFPPTA